MDEYKRTPLHYICIDVSKERRLEKAAEEIKNGEDINAQDINGWTPLHFAAQENDPKIAEYLISQGAKIDIVDVNGNTPLWVAAMNSYSGNQTVDVLVEFGSDPDQKNFHDVSPAEVCPELFQNAI